MFRTITYVVSFLVVLSVASDSYAQVDAVRYRSYRPATKPSERSKSKSVYRLGPGGVVVQGVVGDFSPDHARMPDGNDAAQLPGFGRPMVVLSDGTLAMPLIEPVRVDGMSVSQARSRVAKAYLDAEILKQPHQVYLSLMRKRTVSVSVVHQTGSIDRQRVSKVTLPQDRASVLAAAAQTGQFDPDAVPGLIRGGRQYGASASQPLRNGDTIALVSSRGGYFFSGGLLPGNQHRLRAGQSVNALQAIAIAGGLPSSGLSNAHRQVVIVRGGSTVRVPYSELLRNPSVWPILPGDHVWVR